MLTAIPLAAGVFALCTALVRRLTGTRAGDLWKGRVRVEPVYNPGTGFGLPLLRGRGLVLANAAMLAVLAAVSLPRRGLAARLGLGLALGGGASNLRERARTGAVFDYLRFPRLPGPGGRLVFNAADFAIFGGLLLLALGRGGRKGR